MIKCGYLLPPSAGAKRWVFFHPDDVDLLYPTWARGQLDPTFEPLDAMLSNESKPLVSQARRVECILQAGEVLFVPAGVHSIKDAYIDKIPQQQPSTIDAQHSSVTNCYEYHLEVCIRLQSAVHTRYAARIRH